MKYVDKDKTGDGDIDVLCDKCDKVILSFDYENCAGSHEFFDENAVVYCSECKNVRGEIAATQQIPAPVENMAKLQQQSS